MAFTITRVQVGPARVFVGVTNPTSGAPPTKMGHTAGVPASGTEIGLTEGDTVFMYNPKKSPITSEQFYAPTGVFLTEEEVKVTFTAQESTVTALKTAFDATGQSTSGTEEMFYFGSGSGSFTPLTQSIFLSARHRDNPAKYTIVLLYSAFPSKGLSYTFSRTKKATYAVEFTALADATRTAGDCIGQFYYEL